MERDQVKIEREAHTFLDVIVRKKSITAWVDNRFNEGIHFHVYILKNWMKKKSFIDLNTVMSVLWAFPSRSLVVSWVDYVYCSRTYFVKFSHYFIALLAKFLCFDAMRIQLRAFHSLTNFLFFFSKKKFHNVHMYMSEWESEKKS